MEVFMQEAVNLKRNGNGQTKDLDVELLKKTKCDESYCSLFKIKLGESRAIRLLDIASLIKAMKDPCFYIDRARGSVDLRECEYCQPKSSIYPHRVEANAASFFPSRVDSREAFAIRINCIKSAFSDSLQLLVLFTDLDETPKLVVQSLAAT